MVHIFGENYNIMKVCIIYLTVMLMMIGCVSEKIKDNVSKKIVFTEKSVEINSSAVSMISNKYDDYIDRCAKNYGVDSFLIKAIIQVESNYDPYVVSKSNAVGLMQIKADTAGRDAYRLKGWIGQPSVYELKDAIVNIDIGVTYVSILQKQLRDITNPITKRYAVIVSYVNGMGALLRIFSVHRDCAINKINTLSPEEFCYYIKSKHPSKQAYRYLFKINAIYNDKNH